MSDQLIVVLQLQGAAQGDTSALAMWTLEPSQQV